MKKILTILLAVLFLTSCGTEIPVENTEELPDFSQIQSICELAVMECYYHNVAKFTEEDAEKILWWTKDKRFWVEYGGTVTLGIDASQVHLDVNGTEVTITMPEAKVLSCEIDESTLTEEAFIIAKDSADIDAADTQKAFVNAREHMEKTVADEKVLLNNATQRAQQLLEDYVNNVGEALGKTYSIQWITISESTDLTIMPS